MIDINNDTEVLEAIEACLQQEKANLLNANAEMRTSLKRANVDLIGYRQDFVEKTSEDAMALVDLACEEINNTIEFIKELKTILGDYLKCEFKEV